MSRVLALELDTHLSGAVRREAWESVRLKHSHSWHAVGTQ